MSVDYLFYKTYGRSKTFSKHSRARTKSETTSVPFIIHIDFISQKPENIIYGAHTSVDPGMSNMDDAS